MKTLSVMTIVSMVQQNDTKNDPTVWLDGARPANPCISHDCTAVWRTYPQKQKVKNEQNLVKSPKKSEK